MAKPAREKAESGDEGRKETAVDPTEQAAADQRKAAGEQRKAEAHRRFAAYVRGGGKRDDIAVKLDREVAKKAKVVAAFHEMTLAEYLTSQVRSVVEYHYAEAVREMSGQVGRTAVPGPPLDPHSVQVVRGLVAKIDGNYAPELGPPPRAGRKKE